MRTQAFNRSQVHGRFLELADARPELLAISFGHQRLTYADVERASGNLAFRLLEAGVRAGGVVVIECDRSPMLVISLLAAMRVGAIFLVLEEQLPAAYKAKLVGPLSSLHWIRAEGHPTEESNVRQMIGGKLRSYTKVSFPDTDAHAIAEGEIAGSLPRLDNDSARPMYLAATSGSTGHPKLVLGNHGPVRHFLDWYTGKFEFGMRDRFSFLSGLGHDPMLRDIFAPLRNGGSIWIPSREDLHSRYALGKWVEREAISVIHATPSLASLIFGERTTVAFSELRIVALGGEPLLWSKSRHIAETAPRSKIINFYGTTETPQAVAYHVVDSATLRQSPRSDDGSTVPLGRAIDNVDLLLLNEDDAICAPGETGEICVRTRHLSEGYYGDPDLTSRVFVRDPTDSSCRIYRTGDTARYNMNDELVFIGRKDRRVKCRGYRVQLEEVESVIRAITGARYVAVVPQITRMENTGLTCFAEASEKALPAEEEIRRQVLEMLPPYMLPTRFIFLPSLPVTLNGKLDIAALARSATARDAEVSDDVSLTTAVHKRLFSIWSSILDVASDVLTIDSNFFESGGDSVLAVELISRLNEEFKEDFGITDIFLYPKVRDLAEFLAAPSISSAAIEKHDTRSEGRFNQIAAARRKRMKV